MNGTERAHLWHSIRRVFELESQVRVTAPSRNGLVATLCVLGSALIWFLLTMSDTHTAELRVHTEIESLPPGQALVVPPPREVRVEVEGEGFELLPLFFEPLSIFVPASDGRVDLADVLPRLPGGVTQRNVTPRYLYLETDRLVEKKLPVAIRAHFEMPATYGLTSPLRSFPDSVTVSGAARVVEALRVWPTEATRFRDVRDTLRVELPLSDTLRGLVAVTPGVVSVEAPIAEFTGAERDVDVRVRGVPSNARLVTPDPRTLRVRFRVVLGQYREALNAADFYATISYDEIRQNNTGRVQPTLNLPEGLVIRDVEVYPPLVGYYTVLSER